MTVSFYCNRCRLDADLPSFKERNQFGEWFASKCPSCERKLIRYVTEKASDPYFHTSLKLKKERTEYSKDLLQPGQEGFQTLYKKEWDAIENASEEWERKQREKKEERERFLKEHSYNIRQKNFAKQVIEHELNIENGARTI